MINEANDHPRYAVDVQRDQSKPGHPHATVISLRYTVSKQKARGKKKKQPKHCQTEHNTPRERLFAVPDKRSFFSQLISDRTGGARELAGIKDKSFFRYGKPYACRMSQRLLLLNPSMLALLMCPNKKTNIFLIFTGHIVKRKKGAILP